MTEEKTEATGIETWNTLHEAGALLKKYPLLELLKDVATTRSRAKSGRKAIWRRSYVRAVFAHVEAELYLMRQLVLEAHEQGETMLPLKEEVLLREEKYSVDKKGEVTVQPSYPSSEASIKLTFRCFAAVKNPDFKLKTDGTGWSDFKKAVEVRNRLTHPKKLTDIDVSEDEIDIVGRAEDWFLEMSLLVVMPDFNTPIAELRRVTANLFKNIPEEEQSVQGDMVTAMIKAMEWTSLATKK